MPLKRGAPDGEEAATVAGDENSVAKKKKKEEEPPQQPQQQQQQLSSERSCAEALMMACDERLGAQSPAALMVCDTFLARDFWTSFVHQSYLPPAASQMWAWGNNHYRQLGLGDTQRRRKITHVFGLSGRKVAAVACGESFTLALLESGELFAWGNNDFDQLGLGDKTNRTTPDPVAALSGRRVAAIACGGFHSVAVLETGELFAWGYNYSGQTGLGVYAHCNLPTQVTALAGRRVVAVACGGHHTAAVLESGELFTWGDNEEGQLGHGDRTRSKNTPQLVEALRGRPVIAVACGYSHTLALLKTGEVFAWGRNEEGQLGLGEFRRHYLKPWQVHFFDGKRVMSIHCGDFFSGAVLKSGELFLWGKNDFGQLGTGNKESRATPTLVTANLAAKRVLSVALGTHHTIALIR